MINIVRIILILLSIASLIVGIIWFIETKSYQSIIVIITQIATLISLVVAPKVLNVSQIKGESEIEVERGDGTTNIEGVDGKSKVKITNRKK